MPVPALSSLEVDALQEGVKLVLKGPDAKIVFDLLAVKDEEMPLMESTAQRRTVKTGRDLSCVNDRGAYSCEMMISGEAGTVKVVREEANVIAAQPSASLAEFADDYLALSPKDAPGKAKIKVGQSFAKALYDGLKVTPEVIPAQGDDGVGALKSGTQIECKETAKTANPDQKKYDCELNVDLKIGTVDKVEANPLD